MHVDCEAGQINNRVLGCVSVVADIREAVAALIEESRAVAWPDTSQWLERIARWRDQRSDVEELRTGAAVNPNAFMRLATSAFPDVRVMVTDVGQNQLWAAQSALIGEGARFLSPGGLGAMGFALPAAISAALESGETLLVTGDGGFQMNIQELQSVVQHALPIRMLVLNNRSLGMVRQFQDAYFEGRAQSTVWGYSAPDFENVALAYGIPSRTVEREAECGAALAWMSAQEGPCLLQVMLEPKTDLYPKVKFGRPLSEMEPAVDFAE